MYLHGNQPGKQTTWKDEHGNCRTVVDEGWQIMPYNYPCASITRAAWQQAILGASAFKMDSLGYKILFNKTLGVEAIPNADRTRQSTTFDPNPVLMHVADSDYRKTKTKTFTVH